jgi:hypothetical protein
MPYFPLEMPFITLHYVFRYWNKRFILTYKVWLYFKIRIDFYSGFCQFCNIGIRNIKLDFFGSLFGLNTQAC